MLQPKRTKFRKMMKGRNRGLAKGSKVSFGEYGLKATGRGRITARQIEAARRAMNRKIKRGGQTSRLPANLLRFVRVKVRVTLNTGFARFSQVVSFMKWKGLLRNWHVKRSRLQLLNYRSQLPLLLGR